MYCIYCQQQLFIDLHIYNIYMAGGSLLTSLNFPRERRRNWGKRRKRRGRKMGRGEDGEEEDKNNGVRNGGGG